MRCERMVSENTAATPAQSTPEMSCPTYNVAGGQKVPLSLSLALQEIPDLREQLFLLGRCRWLGCFGAQHAIHRLDDQEQDECDDDEVDDERDEVSPGKDGALLLRLGQR